MLFGSVRLSFCESGFVFVFFFLNTKMSLFASLYSSLISNRTIAFLCQIQKDSRLSWKSLLISIEAWSLLYYHLIKCHFNRFAWVSICLNLWRLPALFSLLPISSSRAPFQLYPLIDKFVSFEMCQAILIGNLHVSAWPQPPRGNEVAKINRSHESFDSTYSQKSRSLPKTKSTIYCRHLKRHNQLDSVGRSFFFFAPSLFCFFFCGLQLFIWIFVSQMENTGDSLNCVRTWL